jgi:hypothetical protein
MEYLCTNPAQVNLRRNGLDRTQDERFPHDPQVPRRNAFEQDRNKLL